MKLSLFQKLWVAAAGLYTAAIVADVLGFWQVPAIAMLTGVVPLLLTMHKMPGSKEIKEGVRNG